MAERKSSKVVWRDNMVFTGFSSNDFTIPLDSAKAHGGSGAGISPMELMLTALAGCTAMDVISILRKKQQAVTDFEVEVEGVRADEHPRVYTEIWVKFIVTGSNIDPRAVERAIELSRTKYCGVSNTLVHTAAMHYDYLIVETEADPHES
jgi:putative redox protein